MKLLFFPGKCACLLLLGSLAAGCGGATHHAPAPLCDAPCEVVASGFAGIMDMTADESGVYVVDDDAGVESLERVAAPGQRPIAIAQPASELALSVHGQKAYFIDWTTQPEVTTELLSVDVTGGPTTLRYELDDMMVHLEVDDQNAYALVPGAQAMLIVPLDGSGATSWPAIGSLTGFSLDGGALFLVVLGSDGSSCQILRHNLAERDSTVVYSTPLVGPTGACPVADLSAQAGYLFWKDSSAGTVSIQSMAESSGSVVTLASGLSNWAGSFVADATTVYFGGTLSNGRSGVIAVPVAGGEPELFYSGQPTMIASDGRRVYFLRTEADGRTAVLSLPKR